MHTANQQQLHTCSPFRDCRWQIFTKLIHVRQIIRQNSYTKFHENPANTSFTHTRAWKHCHPHNRCSSYTSWSRTKHQQPYLRQEYLPHRQYKPGRCHSRIHIKDITLYKAQSQPLRVCARACVRVCDTSMSDSFSRRISKIEKSDC